MAIYEEVMPAKDGYLAIPKVPRASVPHLWHSGYWDGPIDGMLEFRGRKYWYTRCDENESCEGW
jgi:hypothetical protein